MDRCYGIPQSVKSDSVPRHAWCSVENCSRESDPRWTSSFEGSAEFAWHFALQRDDADAAASRLRRLLFMSSLCPGRLPSLDPLCEMRHPGPTSLPVFRRRRAPAWISCDVGCDRTRHRARLFRPFGRLRRRLRPVVRSGSMTFDYTLAALVTAGLAFYLTYALIRPERF
jgi:K+-transporting ATPase KdpF subunit